MELDTLQEELVAITREELGAFGRDGWDCVDEGGQQAKDGEKQHWRGQRSDPDSTSERV